MKLLTHGGAIVLALGLSLGSGCADLEDVDYTPEEQEELNQLRQEFVSTQNGLVTVNGLTTVNGLRTSNGLTTSNGLRTSNGVTTINGLRTSNGLRTANGLRTSNGVTSTQSLNVDCTGQTLASQGGTCTGTPDGILSATTGLMSSNAGIATAIYLVRCALPATASVRIKDYTGALVTLTGEIGLAPEWGDGACSSACEEKVSACLMALTNGSGRNVQVEFTSTLSQIGTSRSPTAYYQEAAFYGNLFSNPPKAFVAAGQEYGTLVMSRSCGGYSWSGSTCPYVLSGSLTAGALAAGGGINKCSLTAITDGARGTAVSCASKDTATRTWNYPITTWRFEMN